MVIDPQTPHNNKPHIQGQMVLDQQTPHNNKPNNQGQTVIDPQTPPNNKPHVKDQIVMDQQTPHKKKPHIQEWKNPQIPYNYELPLLPTEWKKGQVEWPLPPPGFLGSTQCGEIFSSQIKIILGALFEKNDKFKIFSIIRKKIFFKLVRLISW